MVPVSSAADLNDVGRRFAELAQLTVDDLAPDVVHATKRVIADTVGCTAAAMGTEVAAILRDVRARQGGVAESSVLGGGRLPAPAAAFVNSQAANLLDADETLHNFTHFAAAVVMPALAAAESVRASGPDLIAAVAVGYDIAGRIATSMPDYEVSADGELVRIAGSGFSWAALGAAAACARVLGMSVDETVQAMGNAFVMTPLHGSLLGFTTAMGVRPSPWHKYAVYGSIAEAGVQAALLARAGLQSDPTLLQRGSEFWRAFGAPSFDWDAVDADLGRRWLITETAIKPYPFCRYGHTALDLLGRLMQENGLTAEDVDELELTMVPFAPMQALMDYRHPQSDIDVMSSLPYALAMVALEVPTGPRWWAKDVLADQAVHAFARKVHGRIEPAWHELLVEQVSGGGRFKRLPTRLTLTARGRTFSAVAEVPSGDPWPEDAYLSDQRLAAKLDSFMTEDCGPGAAGMLLDAAFNLDRAATIDGLTASLRGDETPRR
jgi:2-methylcitrate dehydratase PrpD